MTLAASAAAVEAGPGRLRAAWNGLLRRVLERDPSEIARRAATFAIATPGGRILVARLGEAFLGGYNAMLRRAALRQVAEEGARVEPHFRPFFFEGAAMGYLPRGWLVPGCAPRLAERHLLEMDPAYLYLYYVGLGFWIGIRHGGRPAARLEALEKHLDPMYAPLCYDGLGFKIGFFDYPKRAEVRRSLDRCPAGRRAQMYQGFGRALFFVFMDDEAGFRRERDLAGGVHRDDLEFGRSLALAFTGVDRPAAILEHIASAPGESDLGARVGGVTWALTAREMNDPGYFARCLGPAPPAWAGFLARLPALCRQAFSESRSYVEWQARTRDAAVAAYAAARRAGGATSPSASSSAG